MLSDFEQELPWPKWEWQKPIINIVLAVLGIVGYFVALTPWILPIIGIAFGLFLLSLIIIIPCVIWVSRFLVTIYKRVVLYPLLQKYNSERTSYINDLNKLVGIMLPNRKRISIHRILYDVNSKDINLVILKDRSLRLQINDIIYVFMENDMMMMGEFKINTIRPKDYYALGTKVDKNWRGFLDQEGKLESFPPAAMFALLFKEVNNDNG